MAAHWELIYAHYILKDSSGYHLHRQARWFGRMRLWLVQHELWKQPYRVRSLVHSAHLCLLLTGSISPGKQEEVFFLITCLSDTFQLEMSRTELRSSACKACGRPLYLLQPQITEHKFILLFIYTLPFSHNKGNPGSFKHPLLFFYFFRQPLSRAVPAPEVYNNIWTWRALDARLSYSQNLPHH